MIFEYVHLYANISLTLVVHSRLLEWSNFKLNHQAISELHLFNKATLCDVRFLFTSLQKNTG